MPGPEALRRKEYYGFKGNLFWRIMAEILETCAPLDYKEKIQILKENRIALWDVIRSCRRAGANDNQIRDVKPNPIAGLIRKYPDIGVIFLNGKTAEKLFHRYFGNRIKISTRYLPSTSPAHASLDYSAKYKKWRVIEKYLANKMGVQ